MTSANHGSGRHRATGPTPRSLLAGLWRRPGHGPALKGLGLAACALGVATAFAAPTPAPDFALTSTALHAPREAKAQTLPAPVQANDYGVIGFGVKAAPTTTTTTTGRTTSRASRGANYSRVGIPSSGMTANAVAVINEVHASFPALTNIGGYRAGDPGDHGSGHAVDIMCSTSQGDALAAHLQGMSGTLHIKYIIWKQRIWYPGGGWKPMADRGSTTANHYDHVHVSVN